MGNQLSRRGFLGVAASFAGAAALSPFLAACGDGGAKAGGANTAQGLKAALPAYVPSTHLKPDIASVTGSSPDIFTDPGFLAYPTDRPTTVSGVPGKGGSYSAVTPLWGTVPPAGNSFYEAMNKALGLTLTVKPADGNNYNTIIPTMTAAKQLPDWVQLPAWWNSNFNVGELATSQLADLTPYLSGDNIKKYPNLAAIPTGAWQAAVWGDKLYGIPCFSTGAASAGAIMYRRDILEAKGITADQVKSVDDYMNLGKELTDAKAGVWAFDDVWTYMFQSWGIPFKFKLDGGKLVHKYLMDEFYAALDWHYKLATNGYLHPDAIAGNTGDGGTRFYAGKTLIAGGGTGAWNLADHQSGVAANPNYRRGGFNPITFDGKGTPRSPLGASASMISYLNKNLKPEQIQELLAVANYLAAPFGSAEYTMVNYGVEGVHFTLQNGVPTATDEGKKDAQPTTYAFLGAPPSVVSNPGADQVTKDFTAWQAATVKYQYKPVFWNMNISMPQAIATADAGQSVEDTIKDCYHGKKKPSDVKDAVQSWRSSGGDKYIKWMDENVLQKYGSGQ